jgi:hypothetical protein
MFWQKINNWIKELKFKIIRQRKLKKIRKHQKNNDPYIYR